MHQVLVYAESLTWGIIPDVRRRLGFDPFKAGEIACMHDHGAWHAAAAPASSAAR